MSLSRFVILLFALVLCSPEAQAAGGGRAKSSLRKARSFRSRGSSTKRAHPAKVEPVKRSFRRRKKPSKQSNNLPKSDRWNQVNYAFGDRKNEIQLSWEMESRSVKIVNFYRPINISEQAWTRMSPKKRRTALKTNSVSDGVRWVRRDSAPAYMKENLKDEVGGGWEATSESYVRTPAKLFRQVRSMQSRFEDGGFHYHVSFDASRARDHAHEIMDLHAQLDEYTYLRMFARDVYAFHHSFLAPANPRKTAKIRRNLAEGRHHGEGINEGTAKLYTVGIRGQQGMYNGDRGRMGFEIRSLNQDVESAERIVENTIRALRDPKSAMIKLGTRGAAYQLSSVRKVERLGTETFRRFSTEQLIFLSDITRAYGAQRGMAVDDINLGMAIPLVRWEERSYLPASVRRAVKKERRRFLKTVEELRIGGGEKSSNLSESRRIRRTHLAVEAAVRRFVATTELYEYF